MIDSKEQFSSTYDAFGQNTTIPNYNTQVAGLSGALGSPVSDPLNPQNLVSGQSYKELTIQKLIIGGGKEITISAEDNIQQNLDDINSAGGGTLRFSPGIYYPKTNLVVYPTINLIGMSMTDTIIDFASQSLGFVLTGTNTYTTGTISSISSGVIVTGSGTTWTSAMIGRQIFINNRWYVIANVTGADTIILASGYADGATYSGTYRIATPISDVTFKGLTIRNSATTAIIGTDVRDISFLNLTLLTNNKGFALTNFMNIIFDTMSSVSSTSNGYEMTNGSFANSYSNASIANGGSGVALNNVKACGWILSASDANTADGFNCTDVVNCLFQVEASGNGGQGIEFVSGCNNNFINNALVSNNTSDGIKLTATDDSNTIGADINITNNGGYGINIAASTCDNNVILAPLFSGNSSGDVNDSGTGTIRIQKGAVSIFGGDGSDGALAISSGTTTVDLGGVSVFTKNYSSISITGTGQLAFSSPAAGGTMIILKSQGAMTLTSSATPNIDVRGLGSDGGAGHANNSGQSGSGSGGGGGGGATTAGSAGGAGSAGNGTAGGNGGSNFPFIKNYYALGGNGGTQNTGGAGGATAGISGNIYEALLTKYFLVCGAGGGGGQGNGSFVPPYNYDGVGGTGGKGGGGLYVECGTAWNFTGSIYANGNVGGNSTNPSGAGCGGGGGGGSIVIRYNSLVSNTGTLTVTGGTGGTLSGGQGGTGGTGYSSVAKNIEYT